MFDHTKAELNKIAATHNFVRDTLEKVFRLADVLEYIGSNPIMKDRLALKGGTAINLTVFDLLRLSVDIDLDFCENISKEELQPIRAEIADGLRKYMASQGYSLSPHGRERHSLDSLVFAYRNLGGVNDNIKVEINYSLRSHIFEPKRRDILADVLDRQISVLTLAPMEIFAAKINALLSRTAARDFYDTYNMIKLGLFADELEMLRKCVVVYTAISQEVIPEKYDIDKLDAITFAKIRSELLPVIKRGEFVELDKMRDEVKDFLAKLLVLSENEKEFLDLFRQKIFKPELVFSDNNIIERLSEHPMIKWKMRDAK